MEVDVAAEVGQLVQLLSSGYCVGWTTLTAAVGAPVLVVPQSLFGGARLLQWAV